jgi:hypothetical protein
MHDLILMLIGGELPLPRTLACIALGMHAVWKIATDQI